MRSNLVVSVRRVTCLSIDGCIVCHHYATAVCDRQTDRQTDRLCRIQTCDVSVLPESVISVVIRVILDLYWPLLYDYRHLT